MGVTRRSLLKAAATSPLWPSLVEAATLSRYPCLQNVGPNQASVLWTTKEPEECSAVISAASNMHTAWAVRAQSRTYLPAETQVLPAFTLHRVDFTGLEVDTSYYYAIYSRDQNLTPTRLGLAPFRTAPRPGAATNWRWRARRSC